LCELQLKEVRQKAKEIAQNATLGPQNVKDFLRRSPIPPRGWPSSHT